MAPIANLEEQLDTEFKARYGSNYIDLTDNELISSKSPTIDTVTQRKLLELQKINPLLTEEESKQIMRVYLSALDRVMKENGKDF